MEKAADCLHGECMWFSQPAVDPPGDPIGKIRGYPTNNNSGTRTYNVDVVGTWNDYTRTSPWRAPGSAPVIGTGCGRAGGGPHLEFNGGTAPNFGYPQNLDGSALPRVLGVEPTTWFAGSIQEVAWAVNANHGGGYSYRLCKNDGITNVTEECFQKGHLDFVGATSWLQQWIPPAENQKRAAPAAAATAATTPPRMPSTRTAIPRVTVSEGTVPASSQWARVPIPACKYSGAQMKWSNCSLDDCAGCCATVAPLPPHPRVNATWWREQDCIAGCAGNGLPGSCPAGDKQFDEPMPGLSSLWSSWLWCDAPRTPTERAALGALHDSPHDLPCSRQNAVMYTNIVDAVQIPADLEPGDYMLSWRWDSDQTNQIWQNCADVLIV